MQTINFADMTQPKYDIFISYRRVGGYETAKHLFDLLSRDGYKVSFDIDTLRNGDFDVELLKRVEECTDFILILNHGAFDRTIDPDFDPQKDWLRQELAHALKLGKNIIPIMLNGFTEFPDNLPADVARVQKKNGPKYDQYYFDEFYNKLVNIFLETPKPVKSTVQVATSKPTMGTLIIKTDLDCRVFNYGEKIGEAKAGEYTSFSLPLGDNELMYVGLECDKDCYEEPQPIVIEENRRTSVKVALLEKYNARKAKEEDERKAREEATRKAEQKRIEAKKRAKAKAERDTYLLSLPDDEFVLFSKNSKWGYKLKTSGEIVIPSKYDAARSFVEGLARVELNGWYGFIDKTGQRVTPLKYDFVWDYCEGLARVELNGKHGYIDKTGKLVIPMKYHLSRDFCEGLASVRLNGKWGFIDKTGKEVISLKYDNVEHFHDGLAVVRVGSHSEGKRGVVDKTGTEITPLKYDWVNSFNEGLATVELNGKWGFIDKTGNEIISLKYDEMNYFSEGLARVKLNDKWGYIDKIGHEVIPLKYDSAGAFHKGLAPAKLNGKWGFIDKSGKEVIPLKYDEIEFYSKNDKTKVKLNGEEFYIDKNGNRVE